MSDDPKEYKRLGREYAAKVYSKKSGKGRGIPSKQREAIIRRFSKRSSIPVHEIKTMSLEIGEGGPVKDWALELDARMSEYGVRARGYRAGGYASGRVASRRVVREGVGEGFEGERMRAAGEQRAFAAQHGPRPSDPNRHDPLYSGIYASMRSKIGATEEQSGQYAARKMEDVRNYLQTGKGGNDEATQRYLQWLGPLGGSPYKDSLKFAEAGMGSIDGARNNAGFGALNGPKLNLELCGPTDFYRGPKTLENFFSWQDPVNTLGRRCSKRFPLKDFGFDNTGYSTPAVGPQQDDPQSLIEMSQRQQEYIGKIQSSTGGGGAERLLNGVTLQGLGQNYKPLAGGM